jgi:hypothetical protein
VRILLFFWLLTLPALALPERAVVLQGTHNTRELGGIPLQAGTVRHGMVYRSGALCFIPKVDVARLSTLHLKTILDFRTPAEIKREGVDRVGPPAELLPMRNSRGLGQEAYHFYIRENDRALRKAFETFANPAAYPILFHCSAGKDRTGIVAALLLELLGASRADVLDDYLQSQRNRKALVVHREWLQEVFDREDSQGGIVPFLEKLGVTQAEITSIRKLLIERRPIAAQAEVVSGGCGGARLRLADA